MTAALPGRARDGAPGRPHQRGPSTVLLKNVYYMLAYAFKALETGEHRRLAAEDFEHVHDMLAAIKEWVHEAEASGIQSLRDFAHQLKTYSLRPAAV